MQQIVKAEHRKLGTKFCKGHCVHIKPIKGNLHITKEHNSLGVLKTNFNFEVKRKVHLEPRIRIKNFIAMLDSSLVKDLRKKRMVRCSCSTTL